MGCKEVDTTEWLNWTAVLSNFISLSRKNLCQSRIQSRDFKTTTSAFHSNLKRFPLSSSGLPQTKQTKSNHLNKRQKIYLSKQVSAKNPSQLTSVKLKCQTLYKNIAGTLFINLSGTFSLTQLSFYFKFPFHKRQIFVLINKSIFISFLGTTLSS